MTSSKYRERHVLARFLDTPLNFTEKLSQSVELYYRRDSKFRVKEEERETTKHIKNRYWKILECSSVGNLNILDIKSIHYIFHVHYIVIEFDNSNIGRRG